MLARRGAAVAGAFALALAACFADLSALSDGAVPDDAAPMEAAVFAEAAADVADASSSDVADATDAPTQFCASAGPHEVCDDFDTTADAGWTAVDPAGGGAGTKDTLVFFSAPA